MGQAIAMFHKRAPPEQHEGDSEAKRLRIDIEDLFLTNAASAGRSQSLFQNAQRLASKANDHDVVLRKLSTKSRTKNLNRDYTRILMKGSSWPSIYYAEVRVWNCKRNRTDKILLPFVLPHEIVHQLEAKAMSTEALLNVNGLSGDAMRHLEEVCLKSNLDMVLPLGLWGDGVPCNYDRSQSLEVFTLSLPGYREIWQMLDSP